MNLRSVGITGMGAYAPSKIMTNSDFEKLVDTSDEWIVSRTGIRERHFALDTQSNSDLAYEAGRRAIESAGLKPEDIDMIIMATVSPDKILPSSACITQSKLGCVNASAFDLMAGCTSFVYGLSVASQIVGAGACDRVLVIGSDLLTKLIDFQDRNTCVLFGDGAGAAVVQPVEEGYGILGHLLGADGSGHEFIEVPAGGTYMPATHKTVDERLHYIKMKGPDVFKFAVKIMETSLRDITAKVNLSVDQIDLVIPHQANDRIIESAAKRLKLPMDRVFSNLAHFGNTSAASIPLATMDAISQGRVNKGDNIVMVGFGAGLTWGAIAMKWAYQPEEGSAIG